MIMWTVQPMAVYQQLQRDGVFHCDPTQTWAMDDEYFQPAYQWMANQMTRRIGPAPANVTVPIWAWYRRDWQHKRPDFRYYHDYPDQVCLEVEVPEEQVLLSDCDEWNVIINDGVLMKANTDEEFDVACARYQQMSSKQQTAFKLRSWKRVFEIDPVHDDTGFWQGKDVQGCFWELHLSQVRHVLRRRPGHRMEQLF
ncbi:MAG TPA: DUF3841 domain-containing protein [Candidatus Levilactobacillus faecigallinarum]|uniref:DUF3841 domain-containing protein n=1 Tax=Candidatus Levilactobacillus faecigallinarum TaxID=2838638 RepID=A0A9D1U586_9LACO|nr:DUF3841 domain-containing protein [Candidatus Levilactobacillus faecigallinarum]